MSAAAAWTSKKLQRNYERCIVGFDVRELRKEGHPASLSVSIWEQAKAADHIEALDFTNGINLFISIDPLLELRENVQVVAFDLPSSFADVIASRFGLRLLPLSSVREWIFAGFDVVDAQTQSSALHEFAAESRDVEYNAIGLIDDQCAAIKASLEADMRIPEHAPFCPCGVWLHPTA